MTDLDLEQGGNVEMTELEEETEETVTNNTVDGEGGGGEEGGGDGGGESAIISDFSVEIDEEKTRL